MLNAACAVQDKGGTVLLASIGSRIDVCQDDYARGLRFMWVAQTLLADAWAAERSEARA